MVCGIFPDRGSNLCLLHWQVDSLPLSHQGILLSLFKHMNKFYSLKTISIVFALIEITISIVFGLFPGGSDGKASACNAGDLGSIPGMGRSPGEGNGKLLQYPCSSGESHGQRSLAWATAHGLTRVGHDLTTKPPPVEVNENFSFWNGMVAC